MKNIKISFLLKEITALLIKITVIIIVIVSIFTFLFGISKCNNISMEPNIKATDTIIYDRLNKSYDISDVCVLLVDNKLHFLRVVALPNDTIDFSDKGLIVNGAEVQSETFKLNSQITFPLTLKDDEIFVIGDNASYSLDSRSFGAIKIKDTKGKIIGVFRKRNF